MKLGLTSEGPTVPYVHNHTWANSDLPSRVPRLKIAPREGHVELLLELSRCFNGPDFSILYELIVPRDHREPGRYQSPILSYEEVERFFAEFEELFEGDGRANVWLAAFSDGPNPVGQIIYDRHEVLFAYGRIDCFAEVLIANGLVEAEPTAIAFPHSHHYNEEFDDSVGALLNYWDWKFFPIHDG